MRLTRTLILSSALIALLILPGTLAFAQEAPTPAAPAASEPAQPPTPLNGAGTYLQNCAPCHGQTGQGDGPSASGLGAQPARLGDRASMANRTAQEWFDITKNGNMPKMMPPWKGRLTDQQIWDTVAYAWSLQTTRQEVDQGKAVYEANCANCHGKDGKPAQQGVPDLSDFAQTSQASPAAWLQAVSQGKGAMPGFAGKLSDADQQAAVIYTRQLSLRGPLFRPPLVAGTGVISGTVSNGTTNKAMPNLAVELGIFDQTSQLETRKATTDANGFYKFDKLPTDPTLAYAVRTTYPENVPYNSDFISLDTASPEANLPVLVYDTTTDGAGIRADRVHYIMEFNGGQALVAELIVLSLDGDKAYVGDGNHVLSFPLPQGAQNLSINDGELGQRFVQIDTGFVDRQPLPPGQNVRQILYRYTLPYNGANLDFQRSLPYPARNVNALIADVGEQVTSAELQNSGTRQTENGAYYNLMGSNIAANSPVKISITGLPDAASAAASAAAGNPAMGGVQTGGSGTGASGGMSRGLLIGLIAAVAAIAALVVALPLARGGRKDTVEVGGQNLSREEIVDALASLDNAYEAGEIGESAYRDQRLRLKAQLRDLMRKEAQA